MSDAFSRLWERFEARRKIGGRSLYETTMRAREWAGEGGVKLTEAQKAELGNQAINDPTGQMFEDTLRNRQLAGKLEGSKDIPMDWWIWARDLQEQREKRGD